MTGRSPSGRAGRPTDQAPAGLGDTATIPNAAREIYRVASLVGGVDWTHLVGLMECGAHVDAALLLIPSGWQYEISNNAIDRGWSRSVGPDGRPDDTISELGPWCSLQLPAEADCYGGPDWFGLVNCGGAGAADVATAIALAVENIHEKGHIAAIATEARRAETLKDGSVHEGAGLKGIAQ